MLNVISHLLPSTNSQGLRAGSGFLYFLTRQKRFRVASFFALQTRMVNMRCETLHSNSHIFSELIIIIYFRLLWVLQNVSALKEAVSKDEAMFGTLDTWLLYKLTQGKVFLTDIASASATGESVSHIKLFSIYFYFFYYPKEEMDRQNWGQFHKTFLLLKINISNLYFFNHKRYLEQNLISNDYS